MNRMVVAFVVLSLWSCKNDTATSKAKQPETDVQVQNTSLDPAEESISIKDFQQPQLDLVAPVQKNILPKKEDWKQVDFFNVDGVNLSGIAAVTNEIIMVSDTSRGVIIMFNTQSGLIQEVCKDMKVPYLNLRNLRLMIPQYEKDSVFVYRGTPQLFKFHLPYELDRPTSMDAFRIDDFVIVDRGNNRLVVNKQGGHAAVGQQGDGAEEFDEPSCVQVVGNKIFVSDTGNKRIQVLSSESVFEKSFGTENLSRPGGMATDGSLLFICDEELDRICVFNQEGLFLYSIKDQIIDPRDIFFFFGKLLVADADGVIRIFENKVYKPS